MVDRLLDHVRSNVVAYIAVAMSFLALTGGAYAAFSVPANSVGTRQLRNHSITPVKLNPGAIGGSVRHWAEVNASGGIVTSSSRAATLVCLRTATISSRGLTRCPRAA